MDPIIVYPDMYFTEPGNYEIYDLKHRYEIGKVPEGYNHFRKKRTQSYLSIQKKLLEISIKRGSINIKRFTVDYHFIDGYTDESCTNNIKLEYANAKLCSDSLVTDFANLIKKQDFYKNTDVLLVTDHTTMIKMYLGRTNLSDRTLCNAYINMDKGLVIVI